MSALQTDTIAAIATAAGRAAIAVVRVSGPNAFALGDRILRQRRKTAAYAPSALHRATVVDREDTIDDVLVAVFHAPRSFTGENTIEISCHGGMSAVRRTLELILAAGARLAEPGEFTQRAYLNGKLDLAQAEAVIDLIEARTDAALRLAGAQYRGRLSRAVEALRESAIAILARVEATIDFPEDVGEFPAGACLAELCDLRDCLTVLIDSARRGILMREGISVVIAGAPNAGKSSLLNALLRADRAIVTAVPGTTRDVIEECLDIAGIPVRLSDTAGLRESADEVEQIGVGRTRAALEQADIVVEVRDITASSAPLEAEPALAQGKPHILVCNKCDLLSASFPSIPAGAVCVSAKTGQGLDALEGRIAQMALGGRAEEGADAVVVTHARHKQALESARDAAERARAVLSAGQPLDLLAFEMADVMQWLGQITGASAPEEIVSEIFHRFCIGK